MNDEPVTVATPAGGTSTEKEAAVVPTVVLMGSGRADAFAVAVGVVATVGENDVLTVVPTGTEAPVAGTESDELPWYGERAATRLLDCVEGATAAAIEEEPL